MAEEKKSEEKKINLKERLDEVAAKNEQIKRIDELQNENARLKDQIGKRKRGSRQESSAGRIQGLQILRNSLGTQFRN